MKIHMTTHTLKRMRINSTTRRALLASLVGTAVLAALPGAVHALDAAGARHLVAELGGELEELINSGKPEATILGEFENLFKRYADVSVMSRYILGADGRRASPAQMKAFSREIARYISRKYGRQFHEFVGGRINVQSVRKIKAGYEVNTRVHRRAGAPVHVAFLVSGRSGQDRIFNIVFEGVNLLLIERTEIGSMLDRRGGALDRLIADLREAG